MIGWNSGGARPRPWHEIHPQQRAVDEIGQDSVSKLVDAGSSAIPGDYDRLQVQNFTRHGNMHAPSSTVLPDDLITVFNSSFGHL